MLLLDDGALAGSAEFQETTKTSEGFASACRITIRSRLNSAAKNGKRYRQKHRNAVVSKISSANPRMQRARPVARSCRPRWLALGQSADGRVRNAQLPWPGAWPGFRRKDRVHRHPKPPPRAFPADALRARRLCLRGEHKILEERSPHPSERGRARPVGSVALSHGSGPTGGAPRLCASTLRSTLNQDGFLFAMRPSKHCSLRTAIDSTFFFAVSLKTTIPKFMKIRHLILFVTSLVLLVAATGCTTPDSDSNSPSSDNPTQHHHH